MADYKDYIVRYDIQADVTKAAEGLQSIANIAREFEAPMRELSAAIKQVSQSAFQLKQNSNITFAPKIDVGAFNSQLRNMVVQVRSVAAEMHAALFEALTGNASATKAMQKGVRSALGGTKSVNELKKDIIAYNKELDKLLGTPVTKKGKTTRNRDGSIQMAKNAKMDDRVLELESRKKMLQNLIKQRKSDLAVAEQLEKEASVKQVKSGSSAQTKSTTITKSQPSKLTNVTPAVIREWKKAFGDAKSKSLTVNIKGNAGGANGALTIIKQVQSSLEALQTMGTFNINPVLNMEAFAAAETQLKRLAALSSSVTAPFIAKNEKAQGAKLGSPVTSLTKDEKSKLSEAKKQIKTWNEKIASVQSRLDANKAKYEQFPTPGLKGQITRDTKTLEKYQAGKAEQEGIVKNIQGDAIKTARTSAKSIKPLAIDVIGNLKGVNVSGKTPVVPIIGKLTQIQGKITKSIPVNVKIMADQVAASLQSIPRQTLTVDVRLNTNGISQQLQAVASQIQPATNAATNSSTVTSNIDGGNKGKGNNSGHAKNKPLNAQERYAKLKETAAKNNSKSKTGGQFMVRKGQEYQAQQQAWYSQQQAMYNRLFEAVPKPDYGWAMREEQQRASELASMKKDALAAFAKPTPFEQKETAAKNNAVSNSISRHQQKAERLRAQAYNSMLPFAQNKEQVNMMTKHRKYFRQAVTSTGITPTQGMEAPQMLKYLQGVSSQMQSSSVAVPWQLQNQINKLEGQIAKSKGVTNSGSANRRTVAVSNNQKPFFDQSRKWAYPFTGQTSFGARTPMAVDMAKGAGVMFAVGGAMSAISSAFNESVEYQNTMRTTKSILQNGTDSYTPDSFKNMERTVRDVGIKTKFSSSEVANAAKFLAMAGYDIEAINASISPIADLALIGDSDLGETADKMTNIMTTFQIMPNRMREAANIMATTATRSNTDLMMLAESAKYGGGVANMYGRNDPNLFGDTMALFGVMGNAGIQASSAGTALRMMYMNLFNPNKKQRAMLDSLESTYGIKRFKEDGNYRAMSDILIDMAQRVPENKMAEVISSLFRITAQPGANAALIAAAGGDLDNEQEIVAGVNSIGDKLLNEGLSPLISLMKANRESMKGNISGAIAEDKQNTLKGLWAQVTSTFEEGILLTLENRQGEFENMLKQLSNYLAKPETIQMMQNLMNMIVEIGKVMAWFVKIWAELYNMAPGLIKYWVTIQMFFTQIGTLISPVISLIGVFNRLGGAITKLSGASIAGGAVMAKSASGRMAVQSAATSALLGSTFAVGGSNVIRGNAATRANKELAANAILAGELALSGASRSETLNSLNNKTRQHYTEVHNRANRIYGPSRAVRAFKTAATAMPTMVTLAPMMVGIKNMFVGLITTFAKAIGFLVNPITLAVAAIGGLGFGIYKFFQYINGNTEAQILAQQEMAKHSADAARAMVSNSQWYMNQLNKFKNPAQQLESAGKSQKELEYEEAANRFRSENADIADLTKKASDKGTNQQVAAWRERFNKNPLYKFAIGADYDELVGDGLTNYKPQPLHIGGGVFAGLSLSDPLFEARQRARFVQEKEMQAALRVAGANHPAIQNANEQIANLREQFFAGSINENEYYKQAYKIRDSIVNINDPKLRQSVGMTLEQFGEISDPSIYLEYAKGQYNIINSFINGENGSIVGKLESYRLLKKGIEVYSNRWWNAISNVIGDFPLMWNAVSADGKQSQNIELQLAMLPDGTVKYNNIVQQVQEEIENFNLNIQDFANMCAKVYKMMADANLVPNTKEDALKWTQKQLQNLPIKSEEVASFYHNNVLDDSPLKKYGTSVEEYQKYVLNPNGKLTIGGKTYSAAKEQEHIKKTLSNQAVEQMFGVSQTFNNGKGPIRPEYQNSNKANAPVTPTSTPASNAANQNEYKSKYTNSSARPTQININIKELAHFDRTTVASSAEERDLIASMENKIAEAVYRIFAEASNQAQSIIDLT